MFHPFQCRSEIPAHPTQFPREVHSTEDAARRVRWNADAVRWVRREANAASRIRRAGNATVLALLVGASAPQARAELDAAMRWGYLENGAGYLVIESHAAPMVGAVAIIQGGSGAEDPSTQGASHFLEHLLFNGTTVRTQEQLYDDMDRLGAYNNASTRNTHVAFMILAATDKFWDALAIQTDMLFASTLPPEKLEKERGIILEELAKDRSDPMYDVERRLEIDLFGPEGYGLPTLGTETSISAIGRDAILGFYRSNYVPENITWVLIGDLEPGAAVDSLEARIGTLAPGVAPPKRATSQPDLAGPIEHWHVADGVSPIVQAAWIGMDPKDPSFLAFAASVSALSEGSQSPLGQMLQAELGPQLQSYDCSLREYPGFSLVVVRLALTPEGEAETARRALYEAIPAVGKLSPPKERFSAWLRRQETDEIYLREKPHYYGIFRGDWLAARGLPALAHHLSALQGLTVEALDTAPSPFRAAPYRVSIVSPAPETPAVSTAAGSAAWNLARLDNGAHLLTKSSPESEVLAVHVFVRDRSRREPRERAGMAELLHSMLGRATQERDAAALEMELTRLGVELKTGDSPFIPYDDHYSVPAFSYVRFQTLDRYAHEAMPLLAEILSAPRFLPDDFAAAKAALLQRANTASSRTGLRRALDRILHPELPEAGVFGTTETLEPIDLPSIEAFAREYLDPRGLLIAVTSGLPEDQLRALLESSFGAIPASSQEAGAWADALTLATSGAGEAQGSHAEARRSRPDGASVLLQTIETRLAGANSSLATELVGKRVDVPVIEAPGNGEQAEVALVRVLLPNAELAELTLANALLTDRIAFQVREREGLAYSLGTYLDWLSDGSLAWVARAGTRPENLGRVIERFLAEPSATLATPATSAEIEKTAAAIRGRGLMRRATRMNAAYAAGRAVLEGRTPGVEVDDQLGDVGTDAVHAALREQLEPAQTFLVVAR